MDYPEECFAGATDKVEDLPVSELVEDRWSAEKLLPEVDDWPTTFPEIEW